ncbi:GNAT family N-acetyltransferase [Seohaeicola nanhaiensis]|uniref:GNAT family N-acetyltransferase n=1 Tax=Seohaeicola nanhaiensis TaxID=1387282 RepID=A0ABV9KKG9_9RHOB
MIRSTPTLNTLRVTLRAMRPEDFDRYAGICAMGDALRPLDSGPWPRRRAWEAFLRNAGHWQMTGFGQWAVIEQRSRTIVGQVGFFFDSEVVDEEFDTYPQVGWVMLPECGESGLALEAARAAHDWFDRVVTGSLVARVSQANETAVELADALGYRQRREAGGTLLMRRDGPPGRG